jgi:hypothetical protein
LKNWLRQIDQYWFGQGSPVTLGVTRILIGFLAFTNFLMIALDFGAWFTEKGYVPHAMAMRKMPDLSGTTNLFGQPIVLPFEVPRINLLGYFGMGESYGWTVFVYTLTVITAFTTMLGLWTRVSTILLALGTVSIQLRNGFILHGGDAVLRVMVLYLAIAPCGMACSLDRLIKLWKGKISPAMPTASLWAQRLISYNVALVYFTTFWHKMHGNFWRNGTATWYPARLNEFDRFWVPPFMDNPPFIYLTTYGTLAVELALGTLVFYRPLRKWVLIAGLAMHGFIEYSMNIPLFAFLICSGYVSFYEGEEITEFFRRLGKRFSRFAVRVWTPQNRTLRPGPASALNALDPLALVAYTDGDAQSWRARDLQDRELNPVRASWTRSLGAWPVGWIPGVWNRLMNASLDEPRAVQEVIQTPTKRKKVGIR